MFHSSSSRHEQYLVRSHKKAIINKKRTSLESEISGADSGYTSSSSTSSPTIISHVTEDEFVTKKPDIVITVDTTPKKKKSKRHQPPRQPDLVYSCPRPLAFPFHNDDHFLPIAEADPRDVARVSPSLNRSSSLQSSKASVGSTRMFDYNTSASTSQRALDTESSYSHQSSILSTIQRGTVRSIRSLFQLPESLSNNKSNLSRIQTNHSSNTNVDTLQRLEIKKGTVQSIKDMFSKKRYTIQTQHVTQQPSRQQQTGIVGATIGHFESSSSKVPTFKPVAVNVTKPEQTKKSSFASRASEFASRAIWKPSTTPKSEVKSLSARMFAPKTWLNNNVSLPATDEAPKKSLFSSLKKSATPIDTQPKKSLFSSLKKSATPIDTQPKKSLFSSFKKSTTTQPKKSAEPKKSIFSSFRKSPDVNATKKPTTASEPIPAPTTTVRKMWKSFKNLVSGKKSSRVGVL